MDSITQNSAGKEKLALLPQHLKDLRRSGLSDEMIAACRFQSIETEKMIRRVLGWDPGDIGPCLGIPYPGADGKLNGYGRFKPDKPRTSKDGKTVRYESPRGKGNRAYYPLGVWEFFADPSKPLILT